MRTNPCINGLSRKRKPPVLRLKKKRIHPKFTNNPAEVYRIYRDCKEKAAKGLIWHKSDSKVEVIFYRFFRVESVLRRLQILYEWKCKREPRYRHLSIFGFYL